MPTPVLRVTWRGRVRGLLKDTHSDLSALVDYNEKPQVQASRPLFTVAQLAEIADVVIVLQNLIDLKTPR